ncbi:MAG TPA: HIT domain-containing protein [Polyangiaceae bacterium]|jgi:ATP adenylyltransferase
MAENLWAPWRMEYILGPKGGECVFCRDSDLVLARRASAFVCLNKYPFAAGHLLVVPTRHVSDLGELEDGEADEFFRLVRESVARLRAAVSPDGVNVGMNLGKAAGAGIAEHLHAHVVPRWNGDTNFMPVIADLRAMPEYLQDTKKRLLSHFSGL